MTSNEPVIVTQDTGMASISSQKSQKWRSKSKHQKKERPGIVGIDPTVHISTDVFITPGVLVVPEEFYRKGSNKDKPASKIRISLNRAKGTRNTEDIRKEAMSAFQARWNYDDKMRIMRGNEESTKSPSTIDYFKVKIDQRDKYFKEITL